MTDDMYKEICDQEAVGSIFTRFFDKSGKEIDCAWNHRCVSISFPHIKEVPNVVLIASGREKSAAISCAIKNGLVDTFITDGTTTRLLECLIWKSRQVIEVVN